MIRLYDAVHQFEPLLPSAQRQDDLLDKAHELSRQALRLASHPAPPELRELLRGMNSYYTHRIEGQHTRPVEIEQALRRDFSTDAGLATRQRLALAHIQAERVLEQRFAGDDGVTRLYSASALADIHCELFAHLPVSDLVTPQGETIEPGALRRRDVQVGRYVAPDHAAVPMFIERWADVYRGVRRGEAAVLAMAAAHQRLGWIHPYVDGNGRVMRLHSHLVLHAMGLTSGLWSVLRGFARSVDRYYALLADADEPRRGDLDGRGNLSEAGLVAWIDYVLDTCIDQVQFMAALLELPALEGRIAACLAFEEHTLRSGVRMAALRPLHYLYMSGGELERGEFRAMLNLGERIAGTVLAALLSRGLVKSDSPQGKLRFAMPLHALRFYFPALWPEAEADAVRGDA